MRNAAKLGIVGFLAILVLIFWVYELQRKEAQNATGTATIVSSRTTDGTGGATSAGTTFPVSETGVTTSQPVSTATGAPVLPIPPATGTAASTHDSTGTATSSSTSTAASTAETIPPDNASDLPWVYVTREGDTLSSIARKFYNNASLWPKIYEANQDVIKNPNSLPIGKKITIPRIAGATPTDSGPEEYSTYTVKPGDTLTSIAREQLGDGNLWRKIYQMNRHQLATPNKLRVGMVLRLPGDSNLDE